MPNSVLQYDHGYFSDLYKEVHGSRPRFRLDDGDLDQWEIDNYIEHLCDCLSSLRDDEEHHLAHSEEDVRWEAFVASPAAIKYDIYDVV